MDKLSRTLVALAVLGCVLAFCRGAQAYSGPWCKVQTHVHSIRDDGNTHPEVALARYRNAGFSLAVMTHHWEDWDAPLAIQWAHDGGSLDAMNAEYVAQLPDRISIGDSGDGGGWMYRVPTHDEMKAFFELTLPSQVPDGGKMLVGPGQEATPSGTYTRAHVLGFPLAGPVSIPASGTSYAATYDASVAVLRDAGVAPESGVLEPIAVIAHPNWYDAGIAADLRHLDIQGIEIYSGHSHTLPHGGGPSQMTPPAARVTWDLMNQWRLAQGGLPLVSAYAADDAHDYYGSPVYPRGPLRAWIDVECDATPTEAELYEAMAAGSHYATTGATLTEYTVTTTNGARCITVTPSGARDRVRIVGILRDATATVPWREVTSGRGSVTSCPNPGTFGLARAEVYSTTGGRAWTQHVRLWEGDDP